MSLSGPKVTIGSNMDVMVLSIQCHHIQGPLASVEGLTSYFAPVNKRAAPELLIKSVFRSLRPLRGRRTGRSLKKSKNQKKMVRKAEILVEIDDGSGHRRD